MFLLELVNEKSVAIGLFRTGYRNFEREKTIFNTAIHVCGLSSLQLWCAKKKKNEPTVVCQKKKRENDEIWSVVKDCFRFASDRN